MRWFIIFIEYKICNFHLVRGVGNIWGTIWESLINKGFQKFSGGSNPPLPTTKEHLKRGALLW